MATQPKLSACCSPDRKSIRVYDETGAYSSQNTGGWNAPNQLLANVTSSLLSITLPNGTVISNIDVSSILPNITGLYFEVTNVMLGLSATSFVPDGVYYFAWSIVGSTPFTLSYCAFKLLTCNAQCCVDKLEAKPAMGNSKEALLNKSNASSAFDLLELAKNAARCGKFEEAKQYLIELNLLCEKLDCGCGCP